MTTDRDRQIVAMHHTGSSYAHIASLFGISRQRAEQICRANLVLEKASAPRYAPNFQRHPRQAAMIERRRAGATIDEIAAEFAVSATVANTCCLEVKRSDAWAARRVANARAKKVEVPK
jgi:hypothetical protein